MTSQPPHTLNALDFPLRGSQLIEASAGTGKTFTIAMLYVRLVLGHGGEMAAFPGGPQNPPEILVVTFTEAATRELRDRIRARLAEAAQLFRAAPGDAGAPPAPPDNDPLRALRNTIPASDWPSCARKLDVAAEWMDEAAISTIHGWCKRMLHEHAFDSQSLFRQQLETDHSHLRRETVRDYWRNFYTPLPAGDIADIVGLWPTPDALDADTAGLLAHADRLPAAAPPATTLRQQRAERQQRLQTLKAPWPAWADELQALFTSGKEKKLFNGSKLRSSSWEGWLATIRHWAGSDETGLALTDAAWKRLSPAGMADAWHDEAPPHPAFAAIEQLREELQQLPEARPQLLAHAARWIAEAFSQARRRRAEIGFDDLLTALDAALHGPHGQRLADVIRQQFPVALIDEFQDTDPVQYRIFERIYELASNRQDCALILIGDPKQAIYAFRGADIHTYLQARRAVGGRCHTLATNFRSTQAMVAASNHCFAQREAGPGGAFLFRNDDDDPLPFVPVTARGRGDEFRVGDEAPAALQLAIPPEISEALSKSAYLAALAPACATQIVAWLNAGSRGEAGFGDGTTLTRPLHPGDIAILVNNGQEAASIRAALAQRGVRSVYLSDKDSVYASPQAAELQAWLAACAEPDDDRRLRAALATATLGLDFAALDRLNHDEIAWESRVVQFKRYRTIWQTQGVLPMVRRILGDFACTERLLALPVDQQGNSGERILTDLLHLAELLQQASFALEGEHALCRFLDEQIAAPQGDAEGRRLRLESDADLVQVVTIHKSKGLEYPLVFLPFICASRPTRSDDLPLTWHDDAGALQLALSADPAGLQRADHERLREDLRKLYVALTRARYLTWLGLAPLKNDDSSAIATLFNLAGVPASGFRAAVDAFAGTKTSLQRVDCLSNDELFSQAATGESRGHARWPQRPAREAWWIGSYSGLRLAGESMPATAELADTPQAENLREASRQQLPLPPPAGSPRAGNAMHRFFKGAAAGTFLHDLLEWMARTGFAALATDAAPLRQVIAERCQSRQWTAWIDPLNDWLQALLTTPLPLAAGQTLRLADLRQPRPEMEFWFSSRRVDLAALDAAVCQYTLAGRPRPPLAADTLNGMLKGYIDLVFEHDGRYYIADYKSNWLGVDASAYHRDALDDAIRSHRYDLQYAIYLFALHRLLQARLPDYDYDRHVGGALYLFLRGLDNGTRGVHFERPPRALIDALEQHFSGHGQGPA